MSEPASKSPLRAALAPALGLLVLAQTGRALPPPQNDPLAPGIGFFGSRSVGVNDAYATLPSGDRVVFDGTEVRLLADDGT